MASTGNVQVHPSVVGYLPVIPHSPKELSTVYVLLKQSLAIADELQQHDVLIVLDQAIYAKAQEIICERRANSAEWFYAWVAFTLRALYLLSPGSDLSTLVFTTCLLSQAWLDQVLSLLSWKETLQPGCSKPQDRV